MLVTRGVRLATNDFGSVSAQFCKKSCGFRFGFCFTKLSAVSYFFNIRFPPDVLFAVYALHSTEYFQFTQFTELVQLIVSQSVSELESQRYRMKKNYFNIFISINFYS